MANNFQSVFARFSAALADLLDHPETPASIRDLLGDAVMTMCNDSELSVSDYARGLLPLAFAAPDADSPAIEWRLCLEGERLYILDTPTNRNGSPKRANAR